jgi:hypothetical protein
MKRAGSIALAMGLGYVLGRKRKFSTALVLGAAAATGRLAAGGRAERVPDGDRPPAAADGPGRWARLGGASLAAARTAVGRPVDLLSERLNESADVLRRKAPAGGQQPDRQDGQSRDNQRAGENG